MGASLDAATALVEGLISEGVPAVLDVRDALGNLPCVLVAPPRWQDPYGGGFAYAWRLIAIASDPLGSLTAWRELDDLVTALTGVLPVETADPISYRLPTGGEPLPAYAVTFTSGG